MTFPIEAYSDLGNKGPTQLDQSPNACPTCKQMVDPWLRIAVLSKRLGNLQAAFQCTNRECRSLLIGYYQHNPEGKVHELKSIRPIFPDKEIFPPEIKNISEDFITIYNQAFAAEQLELNEIAGAAYRKALEFLVKDYATKKNPGKEETIAKIFLGSCIDTYITEPNIQATAKRAAWLGNDETHYYRRRGDKDINDLKTLIRATINWIVLLEITVQAETDMPDS